MNFKYNKEINKKCTEIINASELIFGEQKKTGIYRVDKETIKKFEITWNPEIENIFQKGMLKIFGILLPGDFTCYLNSTPYSMDIEKGIAISASTQTPIRTICHEANHYLFRKSDYRDIYFPGMDIENAKEIFTIVNNIYFQDIMENQDIGWQNFWKDRYNFLVRWLKEKRI